MSEKYEPRALLEFGSTAILLPVDDAIMAFKMLCNGEPVRYNYGASGYKRESSSNSGVSLKMFSVTDYASLALNSVDE